MIPKSHAFFHENVENKKSLEFLQGFKFLGG